MFKKSMKTAITLALLLFTVSAFSQATKEPAQITNRNISDLMYFPQALQIVAQPYYRYSVLKGYGEYEGAKMYDGKTTESTTGIELGIGITNNVYLSVKEDYAFAVKSKITLVSGYGTYESKHKGFSDPYFNVGLRILEQGNSPITMDLALSFSPGLLDVELSDGDEAGNMARGGHEYMANLAIGKNINNLSLAFNAGFTYEGKQEYNAGGDKTACTGGHVLNLGLLGQYAVTQMFNIKLGISYLYNFDSECKDDYSKSKTKAYAEYRFTAGLNFVVVPQKVLIGAEYMYTKTDTVESDDGTDKAKVKDLATHAIYVYSRLQF